MPARGVPAIGLECDISDRVQVDLVVDRVVRELGGLRMLVNNAHAFTLGIPLLDTTPEDMEGSWTTAVLGTLYFMQSSFSALTEHGGKILNIGSGSALDGDTGSASYAAAKEGVRVLTRVPAREWGPHGIYVNTLCPFSRSPDGKRSPPSILVTSNVRRHRCPCDELPATLSSTSAGPQSSCSATTPAT